MGYWRAGFDVVGVDIDPQPNYPFPFVQADALAFPLDGYDAIHASPPCQSFTAYRRKGNGVGNGYPDLIAPVREMLRSTRTPYVIENVVGAPLKDAVRLCGSSFGLDVRRHRLFESNCEIEPVACDHSWQTPRFPAATNRKPNSRCTVEIGVWRIPLDVQKRAMGVEWDVTLRELSEAIPPAYTEHVGACILGNVTVTKRGPNAPTHFKRGRGVRHQGQHHLSRNRGAGDCRRGSRGHGR